jgi:hypothetical protein
MSVTGFPVADATLGASCTTKHLLLGLYHSFGKKIMTRKIKLIVLAMIAIFIAISMNRKADAAEVPLYSLTDYYDYILTANTSVASLLLTEGYWYIDSPDSSIFTSQSDYSGLVPLYTLVYPNGSQYLTTSSSGVIAMENGGWIYIGITGYVLPSTATMPSGWGPMYAAFNPYTSDYLFTANMTEWNNLGSYWVKYSVIVCWVPNPGTN